MPTKEQYAIRKAKGICRLCSNPVKEGYSRCDKHLKYANKYEIDKQHKRAKEGKCVNCETPVKKGYSRCEKHLKSDCKSSLKQKQKRKLEDRCQECGRKMIDIGNNKSNVTCMICIEGRAFRARLNW